jgi:ribosomal protein S14
MGYAIVDNRRCRRCGRRVGTMNLVNGLCKLCHREVYGH